MTDMALNLTPELYEYLQKNSLREPEILKKLRAQNHTMRMGHMQISPEQGQLIGLLIDLLGAKKILEIGTFTGYSAIAMALALPADGKLITCDFNQEWTAIAKQFWETAGVANKIELKFGPAVETLKSLVDQQQAGTFDFVLIDADKANYLVYYEFALQLLRQGGLVAIDNTLWYGKVADPTINDKDTATIRELNKKIHEDVRVSISLLPIGDGLTLARKI